MAQFVGENFNKISKYIAMYSIVQENTKMQKISRMENCRESAEEQYEKCIRLRIIGPIELRAYCITRQRALVGAILTDLRGARSAALPLRRAIGRLIKRERARAHSRNRTQLAPQA